ncbi:MAG TPA: DUF1345 domain-containing protein, partial [Pyrinomonadaceae bacterium]|nr:DUF1345 domain-containing protein [Pyrinomonadaceae bacterium]
RRSQPVHRARGPHRCLLVAARAYGAGAALHARLLSHRRRVAGKAANVGVVFPNEPQPDFLDFAYFSFVIGMTCQVSDVQITSRRIRRIALLHGLLSFGFNTVILVLSLNLASALLSREGR